MNQNLKMIFKNCYLSSKISTKGILAIFCSICFLSCSKSENTTIEDLISKNPFKTGKATQFDPKIFNEDLISKLQKVDPQIRERMEPKGDSSYYYNLQKQSGNQIEFTTVEIFEEINETYIIYRIFDHNLNQISSFPVAAIGGDGGSTISGQGKFNKAQDYIYHEENYDESEGEDILDIKYSRIKNGKVKIDTVSKSHREAKKQ